MLTRGLLLPSGTYAHTCQETLWRIRSPSAEQKAETFIPHSRGFYLQPLCPRLSKLPGCQTNPENWTWMCEWGEPAYMATIYPQCR